MQQHADPATDRGHVHVGVEIGEVGGDPRVGAGEEMIEYNRGKPILEMRAPRALAVLELNDVGLTPPATRTPA